jgi:hypothetical protein
MKNTRIASNPAAIRTIYLKDISLEDYRYSNLLGFFKVADVCFEALLFHCHL